MYTYMPCYIKFCCSTSLQHLPSQLSQWNPFGNDNFGNLTEEAIVDQEFDRLRELSHSQWLILVLCGSFFVWCLLLFDFIQWKLRNSLVFFCFYWFIVFFCKLVCAVAKGRVGFGQSLEMRRADLRSHCRTGLFFIFLPSDMVQPFDIAFIIGLTTDDVSFQGDAHP